MSKQLGFLNVIKASPELFSIEFLGSEIPVPTSVCNLGEKAESLPHHSLGQRPKINGIPRVPAGCKSATGGILIQ